MICTNCNWDNPDTDTVCSKCNKALVSRPMFADSQAQNRMSRYILPTAEGVRDYNPTVCPECGYPLTTYTDTCPWCGFTQYHDKDSFRLVSLDEGGKVIELRENQTIVISGHKFRFEK